MSIFTLASYDAERSSAAIDTDVSAATPSWYKFVLVDGERIVGRGIVSALDEGQAVSYATMTMAGLNRVVLIEDGDVDE